jgi:hypothetical protein
MVVLDFINEIKPDIIHFEEMPEYFMSPDIASLIYTYFNDKISW